MEAQPDDAGGDIFGRSLICLFPCRIYTCDGLSSRYMSLLQQAAIQAAIADGTGGEGSDVDRCF